jgi:hypothetical protein
VRRLAAAFDPVSVTYHLATKTDCSSPNARTDFTWPRRFSFSRMSHGKGGAHA